jgi:predicted amidohydrolase
MPKVAALQFATGTDMAKNLSTCIRMIDAAASEGARLLVLPEFCNHISWYRDRDQAWSCAVALQGPFLAAIAERARHHRCYVLINVSLRRQRPQITVTSLLYGPGGELLGEADKQSLMGHENDFFVPASRAAGLVDTELGRIGFIACRDGISFEPSRRLALAGADILCNSLNSFAFDEASLHVRARAAENSLFMVAANKVGPLVPIGELGQVSSLTSIPEELLYGAGESQVVGPDGRPLVVAERGREQLVVADIPDRARRLELCMGSLARRRPSLYRPLELDAEDVPEGAASCIEVALVDPQGEGAAAVHRAEALLSALPDTVRLAVLPACFPVGDAAANWERTVELCRFAEERLSLISARRGLQICMSVIEGEPEDWRHLGLLLDEGSRRLEQAELHRSALGLAPSGQDLQVLDLPWGRAAILVGDDCLYPELARMAAIRGVQCLLVPRNGERTTKVHKDTDISLLLSARAAENRVCLAACGHSGGGLLATLEREFTLMQPWQERRFDGNINMPLNTLQEGEVTIANLHPIAAENKLISANTHLLHSRPHQSTRSLLTVAGEPAL